MTHSNLFWDHLAIQTYKTLIRANPKNGKLHTPLGLAYLRAGEPQQAIRSLKKAVSIDCRNTDALYHLGLAYRQRGMPGKAVECFVQYQTSIVESSSEDSFIRSLIDELQRSP